jgi:NAD(P)-dependent dehydrogenase (short-subunit alcohol dehydrogenase family)
MMDHQSSGLAKDAFLATTFGLAGKTAVVTGGGGTLCGAMAKGFILAGANVALWGRGQASLDETFRQIEAAGGDPARVATVVVDLADETQIAAAVRTSVARFGRLDILLNGVGGSSIRRPLVELDAREFAAIVELNLLAGCVLPTKHVAQYWIAQGIRGAIINIASMGSYRPLSGGWAYSAAKAAVMNQTVAHARELAPHGIRVNALAPGFFLGKQNRRLLVAEDGTPTARGQAVLAHTPLGRFGQPDELIGAAVFLASGGAGFVSGVTLPVDGAFLCHGI